MLINRRTFIAKKGHVYEAANMLKQAGETMNFPGAVRLSIPEIGPFDVLAVEVEFEDWDQYHKFWAEWFPGDAFWQKWNSITECGGSNEVWHLLESE